MRHAVAGMLSARHWLDPKWLTTERISGTIHANEHLQPLPPPNPLPSGWVGAIGAERRWTERSEVNRVEKANLSVAGWNAHRQRGSRKFAS